MFAWSPSPPAGGKKLSWKLNECTPAALGVKCTLNVHVSPGATMPDVPPDGQVRIGSTDHERSVRPLGGKPIPPNSQDEAVWLVTV